ncbi:MAG: Phenol hydroxylase P5 protein [Candidatus Heimdallarchaeota archaeon LC_2]|nr:MAG: Phenol hydroxylase P5 protein [Candidatus Heimdallarchaeota archaeon LC_2]
MTYKEDPSFGELDIRTRKGEIFIKEEIENDVFTFHLKLDNKMKYYPGQYILVEFNIENIGQVRAYTMVCSSLNQEIIELNIQKTEDPVTSHIITSYKVGDFIEFRGPFGKFALIDTKNIDTLVFIAVNIGINPFISMLRYIEAAGLDLSVKMIYMWRYGDILFEKELKRLGNSIRFNFEMVEDINKMENFDVLRNADRIYICGEKAVTNPFIEILEKNDINKNKIKLEQWF